MRPVFYDVSSADSAELPRGKAQCIVQGRKPVMRAGVQTTARRNKESVRRSGKMKRMFGPKQGTGGKVQ